MSPVSILDLMNVPAHDHDVDWLKASLQSAISLEFATIPPYLCAMWSVEDHTEPAFRTIRTIVKEEMLHMAIACNLLVGIGGTPSINVPDFLPKYPGSLPGGVKPDLIVSLAGLNKSSLSTFMSIEEPEFPPVVTLSTLTLGAPEETFVSIGSFYDAVQAAFHANNPAIDIGPQLEGSLGLTAAKDLAGIDSLIDLIKHQGEGSESLPYENGTEELAHYYQFAEIFHGSKVKRGSDNKFSYSGDVVPFPKVFPMATVPPGGYQKDAVPEDVWKLITEFDQLFTTMLDQLQAAWTIDKVELDNSRASMSELSKPAVELMKIPINGGSETYGPCFRLV